MTLSTIFHFQVCNLFTTDNDDYDQIAAKAYLFNQELEDPMIIQAGLFLMVLVFTLLAIFSKNLLVSAVSLGMVSVLLAVVFFMMNAPFAGGFELSIGAGLISVLFIMAISLTEKGKHES